MSTLFDKLIEKNLKKIPQIQKAFADYQKEFFPARSPEFFCLELNGEAGELANDEKKIWKGKDIPLEQVADEAADVFIALMNYSNARGIDLAEAVERKLNKIDRRMKRSVKNGEPY